MIKVKAPKNDGNVPVSILYCKFNKYIDLAAANDSGIEPVRKFPEKSILFKQNSLSVPKVEGREPTSEFPGKLRAVKLLILNNKYGILPLSPKSPNEISVTAQGAVVLLA